MNFSEPDTITASHVSPASRQPPGIPPDRNPIRGLTIYMPRQMFLERHLPKVTWGTLALVTHLARAKGYCTHTNSMLACTMEVSARTIQRVLIGLERKFYICIEYRVFPSGQRERRIRAIGYNILTGRTL